MFAGKASGQEILRDVSTVDFAISSKKFPEESAGRQIMYYLALNNGVSILKMTVGFRAVVYFSIQKEGAHHVVKFKVHNQRLSGQHHFRGFVVDSVLFPSSISGTLSLKQGDEPANQVPVSLLISGNMTFMELPDDFSMNSDILSAELTIKQVHYDNQSEKQFMQLASQINSYYAYNEILKELIAFYDGVLLNSKQGALDIFIAWHQISRVNNYIQQSYFIKNLDLKNFDPLGFQKRYSISKRMEKRASTLFRQNLNKSKDRKLTDKKIFCETYTHLSQKYIDRAGEHQPYIAAGFKEVARINPTLKEKDQLLKVAAYYDVFNLLEGKTLLQLIYANFLDLAQQALDNNQFVASLQLLENAAQIEEWFDEVRVSDDYYSLYNQSVDGVISSYIKVTIIAYTAGKFSLSDKYYNKALEILDEYRIAFSDNESNKLSFSHFVEQQIEWSQYMLADGKCQKAFDLLIEAREIRECGPKIADCPQIDSLIFLSLQGKFNQKMDAVDNWISLEDYDSAKVYLDLTNDYVKQYSDYFTAFPTDEFVERASVLFNAFYSWGDEYLQSRNSVKALPYLLQAQEVERKYLLTTDTVLQEMVYNATIPVILEQIEKADFETWANRMENADSIYRAAKQWQHDYHQERNEELIAAFLALETKMEQRKCVDRNYRVQHLNTLIVNRVQSGRFDLAARFLLEADSIISNNPNCEINDIETKKLKKKYAALFDFQDGLKKVEQYKDELKYDSVIVQYASLHKLYTQNGLEQFGITEPSLFTFVEGTENSDLTRNGALYFIQNEDFVEALYFLNLLKKQHIPARETKELQQLVGNGIGSMEKTKALDNQLLSSVQDDKWFLNFQRARAVVADSD